MNAALLLMIKKCMCVCELTCMRGCVHARACVCTCMTEYACTHKKSSSRWALCLPMTLPTTSSQYFYSADSGPLGRETALLGEWFPTFKGTTLLWKNGKHSTNTGSHTRRLESSSIPLRLPHLTSIFFQMLHSTASIFSPTFQKYLILSYGNFSEMM